MRRATFYDASQELFNKICEWIRSREHYANDVRGTMTIATNSEDTFNDLYIDIADWIHKYN